MALAGAAPAGSAADRAPVAGAGEKEQPDGQEDEEADRGEHAALPTLEEPDPPAAAPIQQLRLRGRLQSPRLDPLGKISEHLLACQHDGLLEVKGAVFRYWVAASIGRRWPVSMVRR